MQINSDLAVEFAEEYAQKNSQTQINSVVKRFDITDKGIFWDRCGVYYDIDCLADSDVIEKAIADCIKAYNYNLDKILLIGLGTARYISDALGEIVLDSLPKASSKMVKFKPQISSVTGIESQDIILQVKKLVKPTLVIAIDSLATTNLDRIGKSIQITNVGLTPGSGVGASRKILTTKSLGVPLLAIGVPLVASINIQDKGGNQNDGKMQSKRRLVIPVDSEDIVEKLAKIIANGIRQVIE